MRKAFVGLTSCLALVAFAAFSAPALADHGGVHQDPTCAAAGNPFRVVGFAIQTPDSDTEHANSTIKGQGYGCGSSIEDGIDPATGRPRGAETLNNHADVAVPPGVEIADTGSLATNRYAGSALVNILLHDPSDTAHTLSAVPSTVRVRPKSECVAQRDTQLTGTVIQGTMVSCLRGSNPTGDNWNWSTRTGDGRLYLTIGPMHGPFGIEPGLTYIDLTLCGYYGAVDGAQCGTSGDFQQKNGDWSKRYECKLLDPAIADGPGDCGPTYLRERCRAAYVHGPSQYPGDYSVRVVNEAGQASPWSSTCVDWWPADRTTVKVPPPTGEGLPLPPSKCPPLGRQCVVRP